MKVSFHCPMCKTIHHLDNISKEQIDLFYQPNRPHVQDIFIGMSAQDREKFISSLCDECQEIAFGNPDDQEPIDD